MKLRGVVLLLQNNETYFNINALSNTKNNVELINILKTNRLEFLTNFHQELVHQFTESTMILLIFH